MDIRVDSLVVLKRNPKQYGVGQVTIINRRDDIDWAWVRWDSVGSLEHKSTELRQVGTIYPNMR